SEKTRRVDLKVTAAYSTDIDTVTALLLEIGTAHPLVLQDPAPAAVLTAQGANALEFALRVWCKNEDYWTVNGDLSVALKKAFDENGIEIPYQQVDVHMN
ncbi:MAG: mechanosensitive ion channel, partial [Clostridia bacterium]|nr:mechanosensitive ion channel [Clostridia bacterium]